MDITSLKQPAPGYGMLPAFEILLVVIFVYYFVKFYRKWRKKQTAANSLANERKGILLSNDLNWKQWCKKIRETLDAFNSSGNILYLYKAVILCISCKAGNFLFSRSPLNQPLPLITRDIQLALESLYISLYSRHPVARIYLEKILNFIRQLRCV